MSDSQNPQGLWELASEQITDFLEKELKNFQKDLEKLYREDVAVHLDAPEDINKHIHNIAQPYLEKLGNHYTNEKKMHLKGQPHIRDNAKHEPHK